MTLTKDAVVIYEEVTRERGILCYTAFHDHKQLRDGTVGLSDAQLRWALHQWLNVTPMPLVSDFFHYLGGIGDQLPSDCGARAALSESAYIQRLGEELEELSSAWFPTQETRQRIAELEARIREAT